ncbi:hypothetical protein DH2020_007762 [Rehmannia glutinosa]|uniref:Uncharacterized protein n=1 Tax=Rehmannia glutinosa TaxID=99300 RepID=A0ABR0TZ37_REHGL
MMMTAGEGTSTVKQDESREEESSSSLHSRVSHQSGNPPMAEQEEENSNAIDEPHKLEIPTHQVKNIWNSTRTSRRLTQALFLIASSTELFLQFWPRYRRTSSLEKKKKKRKGRTLAVAVKRHRPTADFRFRFTPDATSAVGTKSSGRSG